MVVAVLCRGERGECWASFSKMRRGDVDRPDPSEILRGGSDIAAARRVDSDDMSVLRRLSDPCLCARAYHVCGEWVCVCVCTVVRVCVLPVSGGCGGNGRRRAAGVRPLLALAALRRLVVAQLHVRRALALALVSLALGRLARSRVVAAAFDHLGHLHLHDLHVDVLAGLG